MLLAISLCVLGGLLGYVYASRLKRKRKYFEDCVKFLSRLSAEIGFKQSNLAEIIANAKSDVGQEFSKTLDEFETYISGQTNDLILSRQFLSEQEFNCVKNAFSVLGKYDLNTQIKVLESEKLSIEEFYEKAKVTENKLSSNSVKLGALFGLMIGIVIL